MAEPNNNPNPIDINKADPFAPGEAATESNAETDRKQYEDQIVSHFENKSKDNEKNARKSAGDEDDEVVVQPNDDQPDAPITQPAETQVSTDEPGVTEAPEASPGQSAPAPDAPDQTQPDAPDTETEEEVTAFDSSKLDAKYEFGGKRFTGAELQSALEVKEWAESRSVEESQAIAAVLSGQYVLVPRDQLGQPATATPAAQTGTAGDNPDDDYVDPKAAAKIRELEENYAQLSQSQMQQLAQQQQAQYLAQTDQGLAAFRDSHKELNEVEFNQLANDLAQTGILPGLVGAHQGNVAAAVTKGLEQMYWANPVFREREMQSNSRETTDQVVATEQKSRERKRRATALSGGSTAISREQATPSTPDGRRKAMVDEIASHMNRESQVAP